MSPSRVQQRPRRPQPVSITGWLHDGRAQVMPADQSPEDAISLDTEPRLSFTVPVVRGKAPRHLAGLDLSGRKATCKGSGLSPFRADQLSRHYFTYFTRDSADMTDPPTAQREQLCAELLPELITPVHAPRVDGRCIVKHLWELHDGMRVESVLMRYKGRTTLCVSSQAGCGMVCPFCVTGQMGLTRNLSTGEIVERARHAAQASAAGEPIGGPARLSNMVFMGMDEPMVNYKNVIGALHRFIDPVLGGFGLSTRGITIFTVGLVPLIRRFAGEGLPVTLVVSLHALGDKLRDEPIPANPKWKIGELFDAAHGYSLATGRRVPIECALIKDISDHAWRAQLLADELNRRDTGWVYVNSIPLNPAPGSIWTYSEVVAQDMFVDTLRHAGIITTVRDTRGSDIDGACGQLATEVFDQERIKTI